MTATRNILWTIDFLDYTFLAFLSYVLKFNTLRFRGKIRSRLQVCFFQNMMIIYKIIKSKQKIRIKIFIRSHTRLIY